MAVLTWIMDSWSALYGALTDPYAAPGSIDAIFLHTLQLGLLAAVALIVGAGAWRRPATIAAGVLLGLLCFETAHGLRMVDPRADGWMLRGFDERWQQIAWTFFRHEPWRMPPGKIVNMMAPVGTSLGNTDALPLGALLFKPFDSWLPPDFQYFGMWSLLCAALSGLFAALLLLEIPASWFYQFLGVALILWSPRACEPLGHPALSSAAWMSVAGLWLYVRKATTSPWRETSAWLLLAGVSALVHPYVCVMVLALCAAGMVRRCWPDRAWTVVQTGLRLLILAGVVVGLWWCAGYFEVGGARDLTGGDLGVWSMDLLAPINPVDRSAFLPTLPTGEGQYEGYSYLGLGALILAVCSVLAVLWRRPARATWKELAPLLVVCALLTAAALSPKVRIAGRVAVELPRILYAPLNPFRASGRFFLPVCYAILYLVLRVPAARLGRGAAAILLLVCLVYQLRDLSGFRSQTRANSGSERTDAWDKALHADAWASVLDGRRSVRLTPPGQWSPEVSVPVVDLAARSGLSCNGGQAARTDFGAMWHAVEAARRELEAEPLAADTIYVVHPDVVEQFQARHRAACREIEGFHTCVALGTAWK